MADPTNHGVPDAWATALADLAPDERELLGRLIAVLSAGAGTALPVLRAERLEVVDHRGRARVVIGALGGADADTLGIGVYDRRRSERITLALGEAGPLLGFSLDGDDALVLGVDDPETTAIRPGPYVELLGRGPSVALGWRVDEESGKVTFDGPEAGSAGPEADRPEA